MNKPQYVCTFCGFNMVGYYPSHCPFCGSPREKFITSEECSARYRVVGTPVTEQVTRLNSVPPLGFEHAAYRVETAAGVWWIDCPSSFDRNLPPASIITFTHHHFLGAANQYRELFGAQVRIHNLDSRHELCKAFSFDNSFHHNFIEGGVEAHHIGGHTPGFTLYFFGDCLFICDYVLFRRERMLYNPFGPAGETLAGGERLGKILETEGKNLAFVCGVNYVMGYETWLNKFKEGPTYAGY
jgi:hydroxyacylglutathione hydrolase